MTMVLDLTPIASLSEELARNTEEMRALREALKTAVAEGPRETHGDEDSVNWEVVRDHLRLGQMKKQSLLKNQVRLGRYPEVGKVPAADTREGRRVRWTMYRVRIYGAYISIGKIDPSTKITPAMLGAHLEISVDRVEQWIGKGYVPPLKRGGWQPAALLDYWFSRFFSTSMAKQEIR